VTSKRVAWVCQPQLSLLFTLQKLICVILGGHERCNITTAVQRWISFYLKQDPAKHRLSDSGVGRHLGDQYTSILLQDCCNIGDSLQATVTRRRQCLCDSVGDKSGESSQRAV